MRHWVVRQFFIITFFIGSGTLLLADRALAADLADLEQQAMQAAVERVAGSVVRIQTVGGLAQVGRVSLGDGPCTGLVVSPDGYIISSSFNFARRPSTILVELPDGTSQPAKLVARDNSRSLALLKVDLPEKIERLVVPEAVPEDSISPGAWAIAIGRTFDARQPNVSVGIISAVNRIWGKAVQTDAKISPNNYGGPLIDLRGRVFGVLVPLSPQAAGEVAGAEWYDSGIGFAIPLTHIQRVLPKLKEGTDLNRGLMGINLRGRDQFGAAPVVAAAQPSSPAYKAGVKAGDRIVEVNGRPVESHVQLKHEVSSMYAGELVKLALLRDKQRLEVEFELAAQLLPYTHTFLGVLPDRGSSDQPGFTVRFVYPDSPAAAAGLRSGDRITSISETEIESVSEAYEALSALAVGEKIAIEFQRNSKTMTAEVQLARMPESIPDELPAARAGNSGKDPERDQDPAGVGTIDIKLPEFKNECLAYVPESYNPAWKHGVVIWLPSPGLVKRKALIKRWQEICSQRDLILLVPQSRDAEKWNADEIEFINRVLGKLAKDYEVDETRIVVHGHGPGGAMACVYFHSPNGRAVGLAVVDAVVPSSVRLRPLSPTARAAIYWARGDKRTQVRVDAQIKQLRAANFPVTTRDLGTPRYLDADELAELSRWIDTLDRV